MDELTSTVGIVALAAVATAAVAVLLAGVCFLKLRRLQAAQSAVLGGHAQRDLVAHAQRLEGGFVDLREWVEDSLGRLDQRAAGHDERIAGCVAHQGLVRYDAYGEMSGRQSASLALLDGRGSGVVVSAISHRDHARLYFKQIREGDPEIELSPEEQEAIQAALSAPSRQSSAASA
jgi:hypothetical protein